MDLPVAVEFRMESNCDLISIAYTDDMVIDHRENLHTVRYTLYIRGADKRHWNQSEIFKFCLRMETAELAAVGISFYLHRDCAKMFRGA